LGGSIYTKDIELGKRVASRIETGMVFINYPSVSTPDLPFGGIKRSGYGKELSAFGIEEFVNKKMICSVQTAGSGWKPVNVIDVEYPARSTGGRH
jgi:succinate-semialdehyde dehydrogenase/glutarate-semialdehyde dehydrogenase